MALVSKTPSGDHDQMTALIDRDLEVGFQQEALERFEIRSNELKEEAPDAIETLQDGLVEATAVLPFTGGSKPRIYWSNFSRRFGGEIRSFGFCPAKPRPSARSGPYWRRSTRLAI